VVYGVGYAGACWYPCGERGAGCAAGAWGGGVLLVSVGGLCLVSVGRVLGGYCGARCRAAGGGAYGFGGGGDDADDGGDKAELVAGGAVCSGVGSHFFDSSDDDSCSLGEGFGYSFSVLVGGDAAPGGAEGRVGAVLFFADAVVCDGEVADGADDGQFVRHG
jgi:hypothetical protein